MPLPNFDYANDLFPLGSDQQTLLLYKTVDNNLVYAPGYSTYIQISRVINKAGFNYRRVQNHSIVTDTPIKIAVAVRGNTLAGMLIFKVANCNYVQVNPQTNPIDLSPQILSLKAFKGLDERALWDVKDSWYVNEQSYSTPFYSSYNGEPTRAEKSFISAYATINNSLNSRGDNSGTLGHSFIDRLEVRPDVDYRNYRPLVLDNTVAPPPKLVALYNPAQLTIEDLLAPAIKTVLSGKQQFQSITSRSYHTASLPKGVDGQAAINNLTADLLNDCTAYITLF